MKIEIEISEEDAACVWSDATWEGKYYNRTLKSVIESIVHAKAVKYLTVGTKDRAVTALRSKCPDAPSNRK